MYSLTSEGTMPISVTELRDHCRIVGSDFDTQLTRSWYAAAYDIENRTGLLLRECSVRVTVRGYEILRGYVLPVGPVDFSSVVLRDSVESPIDTDNYYVDPNTPEVKIQILEPSQFEHDETYYIDFDAGYTQSNLPHPVKIAALELAAHHFENREMTSVTMLHQVPSSCWSILSSYGRGKI